MFLAVGWSTRSGQSRRVNFIVPSVVLVGTVNADAFFDALFKQPFVKLFEKTPDACVSRAVES